MVMHIEDGKYTLKQGGFEVGKVAVVSGVQYYWLYLDVPARSPTYAIYTAPSEKLLDPVPGKQFGSAREVKFDFVYDGDVSGRFDMMEWKAASVPTTVTAVPIVATPRLSGIATSDVPPLNGQIDWGTFRIEQVGTVGYVDVQRRTSGLPTESWFLYKAGGTHASYRAPGSSGGTYTLHFEKSTASALDYVTGTSYARHEFECSAVVIASI